jgi:lysozyme
MPHGSGTRKLTQVEVNSKTMLAGLTGAAAIAAATFLPFENVTLHAYYDPPHVATVCAGHTKGVTINTAATPKQCAAWLGTDVQYAQAAVNNLVTVPLSDKTKAAFISFVFNAGQGNFARSSMLRLINSGKLRDACNQLPLWVYSDGKKLNGLVKRRAAEQKLCLEGL